MEIVGQGSQHLRCLGLWLRRLPKPVREFVSSPRTEPSFMHGLWSSASISSPMPYSYRGVIRERERPPTGQPGKRWPSKYATLGANALGMPVIIDGLNERGLATGLFYFPTTAKYQAYSPSDADKAIAPWELGSYILENFATVDEVRANVPNIVVPDVVLEAWKFVPPVHYVVHDAAGKGIVIEYVEGRLSIYDNPLGVMSNSPTFDWHMTNLRNYVNFSLTDLPPVQLGGVKLLPFGQGSGMLGLPGDFTPPSRFVRVAAFSQSVL